MSTENSTPQNPAREQPKTDSGLPAHLVSQAFQALSSFQVGTGVVERRVADEVYRILEPQLPQEKPRRTGQY